MYQSLGRAREPGTRLQLGGIWMAILLTRCCACRSAGTNGLGAREGAALRLACGPPPRRLLASGLFRPVGP